MEDIWAHDVTTIILLSCGYDIYRMAYDFQCRLHEIRGLPFRSLDFQMALSVLRASCLQS